MLDNFNITGKYMRQTVLRAGLGRNTKVHAVGDGAQWIKRQFNDKFGGISTANYLIDLFHMSVYFAGTDNPAMQCYRYTNNRLAQFDYKTAIYNNLPIGSSLVEGGHRHVIQARLKISGAVWAEENVNPMLALKTNRINDKWDSYWNKIKI